MGYYDDIKKELTNLVADFEKSKATFDERQNHLVEMNKIHFENEGIIKQLAKERQIGFPTLAKAYDDFFALQDKQVVDFLKYKDKPAIRASEIVSQFAKLKRKAEADRKVAEYLVSYYEDICPFLLEYKEEVVDITDEDREMMVGYTAEELEDQVTQFLTKDEYRKLSTTEKNQLALERYWKRPKSKWHIGKIYERYVGYLYESEGYEVDYCGIIKGFEDMGRDVIAKKGREVVVAQCKNWSKFRTIYEKHIFQFFGTVFQYKDENKGKNVKAVFYTTTKLSDLARRFASELGIKLVEDDKIPFDYPCIKCNTSGIGGTKIYHLPFDQQYDHVKIESKKREFYCKTVADAEKAGFRRAFRYKGFIK